MVGKGKGMTLVVLVVVMATVGSHAAVTSYSAAMTGSSMVPPANTSETGTGKFTYDSETGVFQGTIVHNVQGANAAHIHGPAPVGENAGVILTFVQGENGNYVVEEQVEEEFVAELVARRLYAQVHSDNHPNGAIRGQVVAPSDDDDSIVVPILIAVAIGLAVVAVIVVIVWIVRKRGNKNPEKAGKGGYRPQTNF
mmetsp:Transcript_31141/g.87301  ORF Transcript_31141/g.87301 Transcript_31141/m.87301 type:complete len:196 (+) Transcript_31141:133-720(+)